MVRKGNTCGCGRGSHSFFKMLLFSIGFIWGWMFFVFFFCFSLVIDANQVYIHFLIYCHKWYLFRGRITPSPLFDHIYTVTQNNHSLICGRWEMEQSGLRVLLRGTSAVEMRVEQALAFVPSQMCPASLGICVEWDHWRPGLAKDLQQKGSDQLWSRMQNIPKTWKTYKFIGCILFLINFTRHVEVWSPASFISQNLHHENLKWNARARRCLQVPATKIKMKINWIKFKYEN